jgi:2-phosphosulfolactate phosphatase
MRFFHFHTPEQVPSSGIPACAVAIDVLRATTTIATALAAGAEAVQVFADLQPLQATSQSWPASKRLLAGERGGKTVAGFDLGNSPREYTPERVRDKRIFMSTTNGTRTLQRLEGIPVLITAALVNLGAVVEFLRQGAFAEVWLVGAGWEGLLLWKTPPVPEPFCIAWAVRRSSWATTRRWPPWPSTKLGKTIS